MVKRSKQEEMAGPLELEGHRQRRSPPSALQQWLEEHRARNGGKLRVGPLYCGSFQPLTIA